MSDSALFGGSMLEDFRYATAPQIKAYSAAEREVSPHIPGYQLMHLIDQVAGFQLQNPVTRVMVTGPIGTVAFMVRYLQEQAATSRIIGRVITEGADCPLQRKLRLHSKLQLTVSDQIEADPRDRIDLWCLLSPSVAEWVHYLTQHGLLFPGSRVIGYDVERKLTEVSPSGRYFLHSRIWVRDHVTAE